jgi:hypothetical protein
MLQKLINIKIFAIFIIFLSSCGGGGGSSSSADYAPADLAAFEAKYLNQTMTSSGGVVTTILANGNLSNNQGLTGTYTYNKTGANQITAVVTYSNGDVCTDNYTTTSYTTGSIVETCTVSGNGNFTYTMSGTNN